jgi:hypothetical protein
MGGDDRQTNCKGDVDRKGCRQKKVAEFPQEPTTLELIKLDPIWRHCPQFWELLDRISGVRPVEPRTGRLTCGRDQA